MQLARCCCRHAQLPAPGPSALLLVRAVAAALPAASLAVALALSVRLVVALVVLLLMPPMHLVPRLAALLLLLLQVRHCQECGG